MNGFEYDVCVIGGGVNGAGIARDAAGRGLSVLLLEGRDLAGATSSASTKLVHGGLRYLELGEFRLVREALREREVLLGIAPHLIRPMDFILPHGPGSRPYWMLRAGLMLYDSLAPRSTLRASYGLDLHHDRRGRPLAAPYERGLCYADCRVDDSRLVVLNAADAAARGAKIRTYQPCTKIEPLEGGWRVSFRDDLAGTEASATAAMLVNAAGPWVSDVGGMAGSGGEARMPKVRLVKGSHIIINRAYEGDHAYILQQSDRRVVFAIPYEGEYTLIGTTEADFDGDRYDPRISDDEIAYLCAAFNAGFRARIEREDVLWTYSGVRPLFDDGTSEARKVSRDYMLHMHDEFAAPMLSVFGGKITTYRVLAEQAVDRLLKVSGRFAPAWTGESPLPGGDFPGGDFAAFAEGKAQEYPWVPDELLLRYARAYGTRMDRFLSGVREEGDLGRNFGAGLYEAEVSYMVRCEFARKAEDILWRRSKVGMHMSDGEAEAFEEAFPAIAERTL
jgi:glycerol-3-phosphate dehydrogenase